MTKSKQPTQTVYQLRVADHQYRTAQFKARASVDLERRPPSNPAKPSSFGSTISSGGSQAGQLSQDQYAHPSQRLHRLDPLMQIIAAVLGVPLCMAVSCSDAALQQVIAEHTNERFSNDKRPRSICIHASNTDVFAVADASQDNRFWHLNSVARSPHIRFYACSPLLITSDPGSKNKSVCIGYLCVADNVARKLQSAQLDTLANFADIVVQDMTDTSTPSLYQQVSDDNFAICEIDFKDWVLVYANESWIANLNMQTGTSILSQCTVGNESNVDRALGHIAARRRFVIDIFTADSLKRHQLCFVPAFRFLTASTDYAECNPILSTCRNVHEVLPKLFYVSAKYVNNNLNDVIPFDDVQLGQVLGRGSFGIVYRAKQGDRFIAVKKLKNVLETASVEAVLGHKFKHPYVLQTYDFREVDDDVWILLELCENGSLLRMIDKGYYRTPLGTNTTRALTTALQIAKGMTYLHELGILHGDLSGNNVLFASNMDAKVCDFGLSRLASPATVATETHGTVAYMPPELLGRGLLSKATDVYSFGVILFELFSGSRAYPGMQAPQIMASKLFPTKNHLLLPEAQPACMRALVHDCTQTNYKQRPTFSDIVSRLVFAQNNPDTMYANCTCSTKQTQRHTQ